MDEVSINKKNVTQASNITSFRSFDYKPCSEIKDPKITGFVDSVVSLPGFRDLNTCPDFRGLEKDFKAVTSESTGKVVSIKVYPCSLPDPSQCAPAQQINVLNLQFGYPYKVLKPSDYKNPVDNLPRRSGIRIDPRATKSSKEIINRNLVYGDTTSLIPAKLKEEYLTIHTDSIDFSLRDQTQLHCSREEIDKGVRGNCQEYVSFDYIPSSEVVVTTRNYKKLTTLLGEFGGILKIITTAAFFVYGVYSMMKIKSIIAGIILGCKTEPDHNLRNLVYKKKGDVREKRPSSEEKKFQKLVERFVSRRSNVDNLMQKLNLLELIEKAVFKGHEKTLVPLVLLRAERSEVEGHLEGGAQEVEKPEEEQMVRRNTSAAVKKNKIKFTNNQEGVSKLPEKERFSYQEAFDSLVHSHPESPFCRMIKDYMTSQLEGAFPDDDDHYKMAIRFSGPPDPKKKFRKKKKLQNKRLYEDNNRVREGEGKSPRKKSPGKKKRGTRYMKPRNSPLKMRKKFTKKNKKRSLKNRSRTLSNLKNSPVEGEE